ncbi:unnamed protein product, partial [marine sediment metagenome]
KVNNLFLDDRYRKEPYLIAHGKGDKDRTIPLTFEMALTLSSFIKGKRADESVFGLKTKRYRRIVTHRANSSNIRDVLTL